MNWLDLLVALWCLWLARQGWRSGGVGATLRLGGAWAGIALAYGQTAPLGDGLAGRLGLSAWTGRTLVGLLLLLAPAVAGEALAAWWRAARPGPRAAADAALGAGLMLAGAIVLATLLLAALTRVPAGWVALTLEHSWAARALLRAAPAILSHLAPAVPAELGGGASSP